MIKMQIQNLTQVFLSLVVALGIGFFPALVQAEVGVQEGTTGVASSGSKASEIDPREIQNALTEAGFYTGAIDGMIGKKTRAAIRAFQEKNGLTADGVCGSKTWEKLKAYLEEAQEMDADVVDQELTAPTVDESTTSSTYDDYQEESVADPWLEPVSDETTSGELKQKLVS